MRQFFNREFTPAKAGRKVKMKKPEMIIFDYGHTLLYEPGFDVLRGERAAFSYIVENPRHLTAEQVSTAVQELFGELQGLRESGIEIHEWQFMRLAYESLGIKFCISYPELEEVIWDAISPGAVMPGADKMLAYLAKEKIRTAVISNIGWSGNALKNRMNRLLPDNRFEFIMASSEYVVRKPNRMLFEIALQKAGLAADRVWYCGDNKKADVEGAHGAGIYPVWYQGSVPGEENTFGKREGEEKPAFDYLCIQDWGQLPLVLG